ncbi:hypothetical protein RHGRI_000366 [Rhododendron griersonianum]|uniref:Uncharacterized protein n=1 Tax=Rhododendron griersonianum TaxID=479676 RepID=A0AAV6LHF1_9ERIC|nr:hypothetical protein RHGRI_000366 [Rhododendron griersonianum]
MTWDIVAKLTEQISSFDFRLFSSSISSLVEKACLLGVGTSSVSFLSIEYTSNIDGLSSHFS